MSEKRVVTIMENDQDHIFLEGKQYISLRRFLDAKNEITEETKLLMDRLEILEKENTALKILLKKQLDKELV